MHFNQLSNKLVLRKKHKYHKSYYVDLRRALMIADETYSYNGDEQREGSVLPQTRINFPETFK